MSDLDARLAAALRADSPPARDAMFRVEALVRLERMRFRRRLIFAVTTVSLTTLLAVVAAPVIAAWMAEDAQRLWIVALAAAAAMVALAMVPVAASPAVRAVVSTVDRWMYGHDA